MKRSFVLLWFCLCVSAASHAQSSGIGILPAINLNAKINEAWRFNVRVESRQALASAEQGFPSELNYRYLLTDYSTLVSRKIGLNNSLAAGYLMRVEEGAIDHRLIQQFTLIQRFATFRLAHRFGSDQTFGNVEPTFRFRYRAAVEIPLNGQSVDPREGYIKVGHEYLFSLQATEAQVEMRLIPFYGYMIDERNKIEAGIDYRRANIGGDLTSSSYWWSIGWFLHID